MTTACIFGTVTDQFLFGAKSSSGSLTQRHGILKSICSVTINRQCPNIAVSMLLPTSMVAFSTASDFMELISSCQTTTPAKHFCTLALFATSNPVHPVQLDWRFGTCPHKIFLMIALPSSFFRCEIQKFLALAQTATCCVTDVECFDKCCSMNAITIWHGCGPNSRNLCACLPVLFRRVSATHHLMLFHHSRNDRVCTFVSDTIIIRSVRACKPIFFNSNIWIKSSWFCFDFFEANGLCPNIVIVERASTIFHTVVCRFVF
mmetsp:Transcript_24482/g.50885  ORF Transcript_24482/g.50885 Transcript_24482/m.50885 type:complete len:261 (-) Transcript_24482:1758-2540(-)